ncbi:double-strand-break repair protein rad21-like protein [Trifolium medium]|uniref:Double-strand-break repair protein rad21-like protein n=1 Tax=Trifolium medium TaxID=97028 RepID=A0A392PVG1_9FABA|nr:double-strand-break repair protein rad21-like protein [Trifolium medium]
MFSLLNGFNESLFPCHSPKLQCLLSGAVGIPEHIKIAPEIPRRFSDSLADEEILGEFDAVISQACGSSEHIATAPETPPLGPSSPRRSIERGQPSESSDNMEGEVKND